MLSRWELLMPRVSIQQNGLSWDCWFLLENYHVLFYKLVILKRLCALKLDQFLIPVVWCRQFI